jgi:hypothetical protein
MVYFAMFFICFAFRCVCLSVCSDVYKFRNVIMIVLLCDCLQPEAHGFNFLRSCWKFLSASLLWCLRHTHPMDTPLSFYRSKDRRSITLRMFLMIDIHTSVHCRHIYVSISNNLTLVKVRVFPCFAHLHTSKPDSSKAQQ